jgi:Protein of unknown function (DUF4019)
VATDDPERPPAEPDPGGSGSIDVEMSGNALPKAPAPAGRPRRRASTLGHAVDKAVDKVVDKVVGPVVHKVVGPVVHKIEDVAEQLHLPVPKTRKSRVLFRSVIVGFLVVTAWIVGLVWWQLRGASKPDLRPVAEKILVDLRAGDYEKVYAAASPRLQEIVLEGTFAQEMANMNATLGAFREITSVTQTEVVRGPSGRSARVALVASFDKASTVRGSLSFHWEDGDWKLLGVSFDLPTDIATIETSEEKRLQRVQGAPVVIVDAIATLLRLQRGDVVGVWSHASPAFQTATSKDNLAELEKQRTKELGRFARIVDVTQNKQTPSGTGDSLDLLVEYENGPTNAVVPVHFEFTRLDQYQPWTLAAYKPIMPMPRDLKRAAAP